MKKVIYCVVVTVLLVGLFLGCAPAQKPGPIVLEAVTFLPKANPILVGFWMLADKIKERSDGDLTIEWKGGPETIPPFDELGLAVKKGVIDMGWVPAGLYQGLAPAIWGLEASHLTAQEERETGAYDFINELHQKANLFYLGRGYEHSGYRFHTIERLNTPQDFSGLRIAPGRLATEFQDALGINRVFITESEIYTALERGLLDGVGQPLAGFTGWAWHEVSNYSIDEPFLRSNVTFIINLDTWNGLPERLQNLMTEVAIEVEQEVLAIVLEDEAKERQLMLDAGMEFIKFSPADSKWFRDLAYEVKWNALIGRHPEVGPQLKEFLTK